MQMIANHRKTADVMQSTMRLGSKLNTHSLSPSRSLALSLSHCPLFARCHIRHSLQRCHILHYLRWCHIAKFCHDVTLSRRCNDVTLCSFATMSHFPVSATMSHSPVFGPMSHPPVFAAMSHSPFLVAMLHSPVFATMPRNEVTFSSCLSPFVCLSVCLCSFVSVCPHLCIFQCVMICCVQFCSCGSFFSSLSHAHAWSDPFPLGLLHFRVWRHNFSVCAHCLRVCMSVLAAVCVFVCVCACACACAQCVRSCVRACVCVCVFHWLVALTFLVVFISDCGGSRANITQSFLSMFVIVDLHWHILRT